eukprot:scaffold45306_cov270-Isochrysis_galbana.AAC.2
MSACSCPKGRPARLMSVPAPASRKSAASCSTLAPQPPRTHGKPFAHEIGWSQRAGPGAVVARHGEEPR